MKISPINSNYNFKGATININALSDVHGHIERANSAYKSMLNNETFEKEERGKINYLINGGDWFINGSKSGYKSDLNKVLAESAYNQYSTTYPQGVHNGYETNDARSAKDAEAAQRSARRN